MNTRKPSEMTQDEFNQSYYGTYHKLMNENIDMGNVGYYSVDTTKHGGSPEEVYTIEEQLKAQGRIPEGMKLTRVISMPSDATETHWNTFVTDVTEHSPHKHYTPFYLVN